MGESFKNEPAFISQLVRIAVNGITAKSLQPIINIYPKEITINDYQELILEMNKKERELTKGLEGELVMTKYIFEKLLRGNLKTFMEEGEIPFYYRIYASYPAKPILKRDYAFYVRCLTEAISLSRLPYYQVKDKLSELEKKVETSEWKHLLGALIMPALNHSQLSQARDNAQLDGLKIVCALKIYKKKNGNYPNNLTALVPDILVELPLDPFTGGNFIYRKEGEGFIVYSLGPNGKDDNGISLKEITKGNNRDNYDIVWKCEE